MEVIHLISGPRNISTAMMYSFAQRTDCKAIDEPFYGYYLLNNGLNHPGRDGIIASMSTDPDEIWKSIVEVPQLCSECFVKNMAHHIKDLDPLQFLGYRTIFLVRNPALILRSYSKVLENPILDDIGIKQQFELFEVLRNNQVAVVDSDDILKDPKRTLEKLCRKLDIEFQPSMLEWAAGPRIFDGVWAQFWYDSVHRSTGFKRPSISTGEQMIQEHSSTYNEAMKYYSNLSQFKI
jgi:hypothetical protein